MYTMLNTLIPRMGLIILSLVAWGCESVDGGREVIVQTDQETTLDSELIVEIDFRLSPDLGHNDFDMATGMTTDMMVESVADMSGTTQIMRDLGLECVPRAELCNGEDEDCDEKIDEDFEGLGDPCLNGVGECRRMGTFVCGTSMANLTCQYEVVEPMNEICDRLDNDCDGPIDEGLVGCCTSGVVQICGSNEGSCQSGTQSCIEGQWGACDDVSASDEECDGADNDCDALIDENLLNICGNCGEVPLEVCDEEDNDCDGRIDEGTLNACGQCGLLPIEVCDGEDNDCDGRIDEGVANACGQCTLLPVEICDQEDNDCDGRTDESVTNDCGECGDTPVEVCDGEDNDCDGQFDENITNGECIEGVGECRQTGILLCVNAQFVCNMITIQPTNEVCNGLDDDCDYNTDEGNTCAELCNGEDEDQDGSIDEGVLNACGMCGSTPVEICDQQDNDCDGQVDEAVTNACGQCGSVPLEICNTLDDDCDGQIDEDLLNDCGVCGVLPVEVCDEQDNDCDGQTDENVLNACNQCGVLPTEVCDALDNDCDGATDENFPLLGFECTLGIGECSRSGTLICDGIDLMCSTAPLGSPAIEQCNFRDDDCDGRVDETFNLARDLRNCGSCGAICDVQGDQCLDGRCVCGLGLNQCLRGEVCLQGACKTR